MVTPDTLPIGLLSSADFQFLLPETLLTFGLLVVLILSIITPKKTDGENQALMYTALAFTIFALGALIFNFINIPPTVAHPVFYKALTADSFGYLIRGLLLTGTGITIAISNRYISQHTRIVSDFYALIMGATLGGMILASASDLITVFVGLETLSITSYILAGYFRKTIRSSEASFKYLVYGSMGTAVFLFGLSLLYGLAGSTQFSQIASSLVQVQGLMHPTLILMLILVFAALAFKLTIVPFHMWAPDVYEGSPTPVSAYLSVVSKTAAFALTIRMLMILFANMSFWPHLMVILAILSMTLGNFVALRETNIKRLLAYSTIAHAGYMLLGLVTHSVFSVSAILYYLIAYLFMNLGAWAVAIYFNNIAHTDEISAYSGLIQKRPALALGFTFCLLSLGGIPITAGFFAKFFLFQSVLDAPTQGYLWLVIIALLNSTVSLAYYVNIIRLMVVKEPSEAVQAISHKEPTPYLLSSALTLSVVGTLVLGIFSGQILDFSVSTVDQMTQQRAVLVGQALTNYSR